MSNWTIGRNRLVMLAFALAACADGTRGPDSTGTRPGHRPGIRFDPATLQRGVKVGTLAVDTVFIEKAPFGDPVGMVRFSGPLVLVGRTLRHPDADLAKTESCFEADSASAALMPRWEGDERRPWFCFTNREEAIRYLGPPGEGLPATVVISSFTIHRGQSDQVNGARISEAPTTVAVRTAAENVVRFLVGEADFDSLAVADSVDLHVAPEGGGAHARVPRARLRDRHAWRAGRGTTARSFVPSGPFTSRASQSPVPTGGFATMTSHVGAHVNCRPVSLSAHFPQLAALPHVGVRLTKSSEESCLATWNATFVFDTTGGKPRLVAAVYDQWEW